MRAIYRHELSSHFSNLTGYVFGAFLLLFTGLFTVYYNVESALAYFEYTLGDIYIALVYVIAIPLLTMRVIAEERKQKTDALLYSLPISMTRVVLGKYLAMLTVLAVPMGIVCLDPLLLSAYGPMHLPTAFGAIGGFFLLGASLLSMGLFVSALTESQAVSAGLCFVVMLVNYFIADLANFIGASAFASYAAYAVVLLLAGLVVYRRTKNQVIGIGVCLLGQGALLLYYTSNPRAFEGSFGELIRKLSVFERFYDFVLGIFNLKSILYLVSVCVLFVYLTVETMEKRRWSE